MRKLGPDYVGAIQSTGIVLEDTKECIYWWFLCPNVEKKLQNNID